MIQPFQVAMYHNGQRLELRILSSNSVDAMIIGLGLMHKLKSPQSISCRPMERKTA